MRVVPSTYNMGKIESIKFVRSLIHKRDMIELDAKPCGTPIKTG